MLPTVALSTIPDRSYRRYYALVRVTDGSILSALPMVVLDRRYRRQYYVVGVPKGSTLYQVLPTVV